MADATRKTQPHDGDVDAFLATVDDARRRTDAEAVLTLMRQVTGAEPVMWGPSIIGFGTQRYSTADGREHDYFAVGLSPRKAALTLYGLTYYESNQDLLAELGPHRSGKGCLYITRLDRVDVSVLRELVERGWAANATG